MQHEVELIGLYLEIERVRFADRLDVQYEVSADILSAAIPDLILQPLVENAIKHGIAPNAGAGRISIRGRRVGSSIQLEVRDSGLAAIIERRGVGLSVTRGRLERLYGAAATFELLADGDRGTIARITVPFRTLASAPTDLASTDA